MSTPESTVPVRPSAPTLSSLRESLEPLLAYLLWPVRFVAFWLAALSPFAYLPAFVTGAVTDPTLFVGALALNAVALVCGHGHGRE